MKATGLALPTISAATIANPGPEAIEAAVAAVVRKIDDIPTLLDGRAQADALATYLATRTGAQGPMHGAKRRIEARIGELLGEAVPGRPPGNPDRGQDSVLDDRIRADFRLLAHAYSDAPLTDEEWRYGRRTVVRAVREKLGLVPETPPAPGWRIRHHRGRSAVATRHRQHVRGNHRGPRPTEKSLVGVAR